MKLRPFQVPDSRVTGASPARLAARRPAMVPSSGMWSISPGVVTLEMPAIEVSISDRPADFHLIDLGDATILPGLIDLHTHLTDRVGTRWEEVLITTTPAQAALYGAAHGLTTLRAGFTTVRDMGPTWPYTDVDLRDVINAGVIPGPRMQVAGNYVSATGGARQFSLYVGVIVPRDGAALGIPEELIRRSTEMMRYRNAAFRRAMEAGLTVGFSTDAGVFEHGHNAREFQLRVENGQSEMDAITSATSVSAMIMGWEADIGSLEAGKYADVIAVPGNPLDDITLLERVMWVMKGGEVYRD